MSELYKIIHGKDQRFFSASGKLWVAAINNQVGTGLVNARM